MDEQIYHIPIGTSILRNGIALTLTEEGWRAELQHSMMRRCKGWDYCRPWIYLITIGCQHHDEPPMPQSIPVKSSCSGSNSTPQSSSGDSPNRPEVTITFNAVGNYSLLAATERIQIQCSRSMTEEAIAQKIEEVLALCEHGVVPISPCISPGEKAIARAVMDACHNLIALFPQGIPDTTFKPYKQFFDACATGQLLLLSPWKYEHGVSHVKRRQCLFLNDIAAQLTVR